MSAFPVRLAHGLIMAVLLCTAVSAAASSSLDLGEAARWNALVEESFSASSSDVEGRLAAGGNVEINHYSIGETLGAGDSTVSLLVGGDLVFPDGRIHEGSVRVAGSAAGLGQSVRSGLQPHQQLVEGQPLPFAMADTFDGLRRFSAGLANVPANGTSSIQWGTVKLTGDCRSGLKVFALDGQALLDANGLELNCVHPGMSVLINVSGSAAGLTDMSLEALAPHQAKTLFNFHAASTLTLTGVAVRGSVLAPNAQVEQPQGVLHGTLMARSWNGAMQLNHVPFQGQGGFDRCDLYPIALPQSVIDTTPVGGQVNQMPRGTGAGNYSWLSWTGANDAPTLAASLAIPGDSWRWINPDDAGDLRLDPSDWIEGAPGSMNSSAVRAKMDALIGKVIHVPVFDQVRGQGANLDYRMNQVARIVPTAYRLNGQGWLSFRFEGLQDCANRPPLASDLDVSVTAGESIAFTLAGHDPDGDALAWNVLDAPASGSLGGTAPEMIYTAAEDFSGEVSFRYQVSDGTYSSAEALVRIQVTGPGNVAPQAQDASHILDENGTLDFVLNASDADGDTLTFEIVEAPANGTLSGTAPNLSYTPNAGFSGSDTLRFRVSDGELQSEIATVTFTVNAINHAPVAQAAALTLDEDGSLNFVLSASDFDGDTLTFEIVEAPVNGVLSGTAPNLSYTPNAGFSGSDALGFRVSDGELQSEIATVSFTVNAINHAPVSQSAALSVDEDGSVWFVLQASDSDGDTLTFEIVQAPADGTLSGTAPNLGYTPNPGFSGSDTLRFRVSDGELQSEIATVTFTVNAINHAPVAQGAALTLDEDGSLNFVLSATDPDGDTLTYEIVEAPANGVLSGTAPNLSYTPNAGFSGSDTLRFRVSDSELQSEIATVAFTVTAINHAPIAQGAALTLDEDGSLNFVLSASDPDGDTLTFEIVEAPANGTLAGTAPNLSYTPNPGFSGSDTLRFQVSDGELHSELGTVTFTVNEINHAPVAQSAALILDEDGSLNFVLTASDPDGDTLTFEIVEGPTNGELTGAGANRAYTPNPGFSGSDQLRFRVSDGALQSELATVSFTVNAINHAPVAQGAALTLDEDGSLSFVLSASDPDGDTLTFEIVEGPTNGELTGAGANRAYTPNPGFSGSDTLRFQVSDGELQSQIATVTFTVNAINHAPVAQGAALTLDEDGSLSFVLSASDPDGDTLTFEIVEGSTNGELTGAGANRTYTPNPGFSGSDTLRFQVSDGELQSQIATVTFTVNAINHAPVAQGAALTLDEDGSLNFVLSASDPDGDTLTFEIVEAPASGVISGVAPELQYTPAPDFNGSDTLQFRVSDGALQSELATVEFTITAINDAPLAIEQTVTVAEDGQIQIQLTGTDVESDALTFSVVDMPVNGMLEAVGDQWIYRPTADFNGSDAFTFVANDGVASSDAVNISITVSPVNDAPVAHAGQYELAQGGSVAITLSGADVDGDALSFVIVSPPTNGALEGEGAEWTWTPESTFSGEAQLVFRASDGQISSADATVQLTVTPRPNSAPIASMLEIQLGEDASTEFAPQGSDPDGDTLSFEVISQPQHGSIDTTGALWRYVPHANYHGTDLITYIARDASLSSEPAEIRVTVTAVNDAPVAIAAEIQTQEDQPIEFALAGSDIDGDPLNYQLAAAPAHGSLEINGATARYVPSTNYHGTDAFQFTASDGELVSDPASTQIVVVAVNDAPTAQDLELEVIRGEVSALTLAGEDVDGDALTFRIVSAPVAGTLSGAPPELEYVATQAGVSADAFTYVVNDGTVDSIVATVSIAIESNNEAPAFVTTPVIEAIEGMAYVYDADASDPDNDPLSYTLESGPDGMTIDPVSGEVQWTADAAYSRGHLMPNTSCSASSISSGEPRAEIVLAMDKSGSMDNEWEYLSRLLPEVDAQLSRLGIGSSSANRYGAAGFAAGYGRTPFSEGDWGLLEEVAEAVRYAELDGPGGADEVYSDGIKAVLSYPFTPGSVRHGFVAMDEGVQVAPAVYAHLPQALRDARIVLHAIQPYPILCADGRRALGVDGTLQAFVSDGQGGISRCPLHSYMDTVPPLFVNVALESGGTAWSISDIGATPESIRQFTALAVNQVSLTTPTFSRVPGSDLAVYDFALSPDAPETLVVLVGNRGEVASKVGELRLIDRQSELVLAHQPLQPLEPGDAAQIDFALPGGQDSSSLAVEIVVDSDCSLDNNRVDVPLASIRTADPSGSSAIQSWMVNVAEQNQPPVLQPAAPIVGRAGVLDHYALEAFDPDRGDTLAFSLAVPTDGVSIDPATGMLYFVAPAAGLALEFEVVVTDLAGASASQIVRVETPAVERLLQIISEPSYRTSRGLNYVYEIAVEAEPDAQLSYELLRAPAGMTVGANGDVRWQVPSDFDSSRIVYPLLRVRDQFGIEAIQIWELRVFEQFNSPPEFVTALPAPLELPVGQIKRTFSTRDSDLPWDMTSVSAEKVPPSTTVTPIGWYNVPWRTDRGFSYVGPEYPPSVPEAPSRHDPFCADPGFAAGTLWPVRRTLVTDTEFTEFSNGGVSIGRIMDTNGDGTIDEHDDAAIVLGAYDTATGSQRRSVVAYSAVTGERLWMYRGLFTHNNIEATIPPVLVDLDGVPGAEIIVKTAWQGIYALSGTGDLLWHQPSISGEIGEIRPIDINVDGVPEFITGRVIFDGTGRVVRTLPLPSAFAYPTPKVIDIDQDGNPELLYLGGIIVDTYGQERFRISGSDLFDVRYTAVGQLDDDPELELAAVIRLREIVDGREVFGHHYRSWNHDWTQRGDAQRLPSAEVGEMVIADIDGLPGNEVMIGSAIRIIQPDGSRLVSGQRLMQDHRGSAAVVDLDGNGVPEILNGGQYVVRDGQSGNVLVTQAEFLHLSTMPTFIADVDSDGQIEQFKVYQNRIEVYTPSKGRWTSGPHGYPYPGFAMGMADADGTFRSSVNPRGEAGLVIPRQASSAGLPDLWVGELEVDADDARIVFSARVANRGPLPTTGPATVTFFSAPPQAGGVPIGSAAVGVLRPAESVRVQVQHTEGWADIGNEVYVEVESDQPMLECLDTNNAMSAAPVHLRAADLYGGVDHFSFAWTLKPQGVELPITVHTLRIPQLQELVFDNPIVDPRDDERALWYDFYSGQVAGMEVDTGTGQFRWRPTLDQIGSYQVFLRRQTLLRDAAAVIRLRITVDPAVASPPTIVSTPPGVARVGALLSYAVEAVDADSPVLSYGASTDAPGELQIDAATGLLQWLPAAEGAAEILVWVSDGDFPRVEQAFAVAVGPANRAPEITSSAVTTVLAGQSYQYSIQAQDPDGDVLEYALTTAPTGMQIDAATGQISWPTDESLIGSHEVLARVTDAFGGYATQAWTLTVQGQGSNAPPTITSTPTTQSVAGSPWTYTVQASDADGDVLSFELLSAPAGASLDSASGLLQWTPAESDVGAHAFQIRVSDGRGGEAAQSFELVVSEAGLNQPPQILSAPANTAKVGREYRYPMLAEDADGDVLNYVLMSGPAGMQIDAASGLLTWTPAEAGSVDVSVRVDDGQAWQQQDWTITVLAAEVPLVVEVSVTPTTVDAGGTVEVTTGITGAAGPISIEATLAGAPIEIAANAVTPITAPQVPGCVDLLIEVSDGHDTANNSAQFCVADPNDTDAPIVQLLSPDDNAEITAPSVVRARVEDASLAHWRLYRRPANSPSATPTLLAQGSDTFADAQIHTFDPTLLINGQYSLILQATDTSGRVSTDSVVVRVTGEMKVGHFQITFEDVSLSLAGIPIRVTRTYDTRQRDESLDFGMGWSVDYQNVRLRESAKAGFSWRTYQTIPGQISDWCTVSNGDRVVTVTLPDGAVESFRAKVEPECTFAAPENNVHLVFEPIDGTDSTLEQTNYGLLQVLTIGGSGVYNVVDPEAPGDPVDPRNYRLTTPEGLVYEIDQFFGVRRVIEPNGQSLSYSDAGIVHSTGVGVAFERDAQGRIEAIVLPDGERIEYAFTAEGDLDFMRDALEQLTRFSYKAGFPHYLEAIFDPRGVRAIRNEYDDDGRLSATIDADGHRIEYTHDIEGRTEQIRDRRGHLLTYVYDEEGRVLTESNHLGETIQHQYDADGNEVVRIDPLHNRTEWTYDARGNVLTETNAENETTTREYDSRNNLLVEYDAANVPVIRNQYRSNTTLLTSMTDALDNVTSFGYDIGDGTGNTGELDRMRDAGDGWTTFEIDHRGWRVAETDALDHVTDYTHDAMGRVLTETTSRTKADGSIETLVTSYVYDDKGRLIRTTYPDNSFSTTEYNAIDKPERECDVLNRCTVTQYDDRGNVERIDYPDGTFETKAYDPNGNLIEERDRAGRTTRHRYDAADRLIETLHPDDTPGDDTDNPRSRSEYDAAGRLTVSIDARGARTRYGYDDAGRRTTVTDALEHTSTTVYDNRGRRERVIDALNRVTRFVYDEAGRLIETVHPDAHVPSGDDGNEANNPRSRTDYDALGRKIAQTDELGRTTRYAYDKLGRLIAVALPNADTGANPPLQQDGSIVTSPDSGVAITRYRYDERGNKTAQIDALGRITQWEYDAMGRETARVLPMGQRETRSYNEAGQLDAATDFNGNTVSWIYDSVGRIERIDWPNMPDVAFSYHPSGERATATNAEGSLRQWFDAQGRLSRHEDASGRTIDYGYDANGNLTTRMTARQTTTYGYDVLNRLETVTAEVSGQPAQHSAYAYDAVGNRAEKLTPDGVRTEYRFDARNRLNELIQRSAAGILLFAASYSVDASGMRTGFSESDTQGSLRTVSYQYDGQRRLIEEAISHRETSHSRLQTWTYDAVGNRLTQRIESGLPLTTAETTYSYDANDRLQTESLSLDGGIASLTTYGYDAQGNTRWKEDPFGRTDYDYDDANRLIEARTAETTTRYAYDADNKRLLRETETLANLTRETYLSDPNFAYAEVIEEWTRENNGPDTLTAVYTHGDELLSQVNDPTSNPQTRIVHSDGFGSTRWLSDLSGTQTDSIEYDAFGVETARTGSTQIEHLYRGEQFDGNVGFYYLRARFYAPGNGRFLTQDWFSGLEADPQSLHKYLFNHNDPLNRVDPSGNTSLIEQVAKLGITGGLGGVAINAAYNIGEELALQYFVMGELTALGIQAAIMDVSNLIPAGAKKLNAAWQGTKGIVRFLYHYRKFIRSSNTRKSWNAGNHTITIQGPSGSVETDVREVFRRKWRKKNYVLQMGGKAGRVFEVKYQIGKPGKRGPGQGYFLFRLDYLDYREYPPVFNIHTHIIYDDYRENHGEP